MKNLSMFDRMRKLTSPLTNVPFKQIKSFCRLIPVWKNEIIETIVKKNPPF